MEPNQPPTNDELVQQIQKILSSKTFSSSIRHSAILSYLTDKAISNQEVTEQNVLHDLFHQYLELKRARETDIVRVTILHLRARLKKYYSGEGAGDPLIVEITKNRYGLSVTPNEHLPAVQSYKEGLYALTYDFRASPIAAWNASRKFTYAIENNPDYAPAHDALAHSTLLEILCTGRATPPLAELLSRASKAANRAISLDQGLWRPHLVLGILHCCHYEWHEARRSFERALQMAPSETKIHGWYLIYQLAISVDKDYATPINPADFKLRFPRIRHVYQGLTQRREQYSSDALSAAVSAIFWHVMRYRHAASDILDPEVTWLTRLANSFATSSDESLRRFAPDFRKNYYEFQLFLTQNNLATDLYQGLAVYLAAVTAEDDVLQREFNYFLERSSDFRPFQAAIAYLAVRDFDTAIQKLQLACDEHDPFTIWLHLWPIFDPLRQHQAFRELLHRTRPPNDLRL